MSNKDDIVNTDPMCHFKPMMLGANEYGSWWECSTCGHTKTLEQAAFIYIGKQFNKRDDELHCI